MRPDARLEYIKYRIASAYKAYEAAKVLAENNFWNSAVNRLYYAVFYATNALMVKNGINIQSHSGLKSQFSLYFVKTGKIDKKFGRLLAKLYDWRQKGDYEHIGEFDNTDVEPLFPQVKEMIDVIKVEIDPNDRL